MTAAPSTDSALEALTQAALAVHADEPAAAAQRLASESPALLAGASLRTLDAWARNAEHLLLGHHNDPAGLQALLAQLPEGARQQPPLAGTLARSRVACALAAYPVPDAASLPDWPSLPSAERVRAHYNAALAHSRAERFATTTTLVADAALAAAQAPDDLATQRSLAALANNVAADLRYGFVPGEKAAANAMVHAAQVARDAWARAGGWLEVERADWQLAMCCATAGRGPEAQQHAAATLAACQTHQADDYEFCFAWQASALAAMASRQREAAQHARAQMAQHAARLSDATDAAYAEQCLAELDAAYARLTVQLDNSVMVTDDEDQPAPDPAH